MDIQKILSILALVVGVFVLGVSVALMGTPITDIGMLSTTLVFVLLGVFGLLLSRQEQTA